MGKVKVVRPDEVLPVSPDVKAAHNTRHFS